jgi:hypothetical protein
MTEHEPQPSDDEDIATLRAHNTALQVELKDAQQSARTLLLQSELKAEAVRAGMVDLDGLKLLTPGGVYIDDDGLVIGARTVIAELRHNKPWLFHALSSSNSASVPVSSATITKLATEMTLEEWRTARADLLRRR